MTGHPGAGGFDAGGFDAAGLGTATNDNGTVIVSAGAGGAIESVELTNAALERGGSWLASEILRTCSTASARAKVKARAALRGAGLPDGVLDAIGLPEHKRAAEELDSTTPSTWRVQ